MGNIEGEKPAKPEKVSSPREHGSFHVYPDWAAVQAYYGPGALPPPYFNPAVTSGHAVQPYMWPPPQMMTPYGSPYAAMYSHGGMYGPSTAPVVATPLSLETPAKLSGKDGGSGKVSKESDLHAASCNGNSNADSAGDGGIRVPSQRFGLNLKPFISSAVFQHESGLVTEVKKVGQERTIVVEVVMGCLTQISASFEGSHHSPPLIGTCNMQMNSVVPGIPMASVKPVGSTPLPTLEMNHCLSAGVNANTVNTAAPCAPRSSGIGLQDERELKREKRKQSNRESARRSRLRKQAEMEELGNKVDSLNVENLALRFEIKKLVEDCEQLRSENAALVDNLKNMQEPGEEMGSYTKEIREKTPINTENLLSRVNNLGEEK
ncbi:Common plant regulatory factor 1 [Bienertia sinuspersici]